MKKINLILPLILISFLSYGQKSLPDSCLQALKANTHHPSNVNPFITQNQYDSLSPFLFDSTRFIPTAGTYTAYPQTGTIEFDNSVSTEEVLTWQNQTTGNGFYIGTSNVKSDISNQSGAYSAMYIGNGNMYNIVQKSDNFTSSSYNLSGDYAQIFHSNSGAKITDLKVNENNLTISSQVSLFGGLNYDATTEGYVNTNKDGYSILDMNLNDARYLPLTYTSSIKYQTILNSGSTSQPQENALQFRTGLNVSDNSGVATIVDADTNTVLLSKSYALANYQKKLVAGTGITISSNTISASGTSSVSATSPLTVTSGTAIALNYSAPLTVISGSVTVGAGSVTNSMLTNSTWTANGVPMSLGTSSSTIGSGTGISITSGSVITNTAPNQTVSLTGAGTTTVSGTYPTFTINTTSSVSTGTTNNVAIYTSSNTIGALSSPTFSVGTTHSNKFLFFGNGATPHQNSTVGDPTDLFEITYDGNLDTLFVGRVNTYGNNTSGGANNWHWDRYRGTPASPTAIQNNDFMMSMGFRGWDGTQLSQSKAAYQCYATENWTSSANGCAFNWATTPNGSNVRADQMFLNGSGQLLLGGQKTSLNSTSQTLDIQTNANNASGSIFARNNNSGSSAVCEILMQNNNNNYFAISMPSTTWSNGGSTAFHSDATNFFNKSTNGLHVISNGATTIYTGGVNLSNAAMTISTGQNVYIGGTVTATAKLHVAPSTTATASFRIPPGSTVSNPNDGEVWYDNTQKCFISNVNGINQYDCQTIYTQTAAVTVANTTVSTSVLTNTISIPANFLTVGKTIEFKISGFHSATANPNITISVTTGTTTILTTGAVNSQNNTNGYFDINGNITCQSTGTTGTVYAQGLYREVNGNTASDYQMVNTSATTINTTTSENINVTLQWGTASASNTSTITNAYFRVLK